MFLYTLKPMNRIFVIGIFLLLAVMGGYFLGEHRPHMVPELSLPFTQISVLRKGEDGLVNPILDYEVGQNYFTGELKGIKSAVEKVIDEEKKEGHTSKVGVYFRDLQDGPWFGINEDDKFAPASLLKVPLLIAYYKLASDDPTVLDKKIIYDDSYPFSDQNKGEYFQPEKQIVKGKTYTVEELIEYMIIYSDNNAKNLLELNLPVEKEAKIYTDLNVPDILTEKDTGVDVLSVRQNAAFYRVLYNASYLSIDMSKKALNLLTQSRRPKGMLVGLPNDLVIANKFGERSLDDSKQLHDCGIVYYPKNPYMFCIMTMGDSFPEQAEVISDIAKAIFLQINSQVHSYKTAN